MRVAALVMLALATSACRTDVGRWWSGTVDGEPMLLKIEQTGSSLEGEVCNEHSCTPIQWGEIEERDVEILYGCEGCAIAPASLDLVLQGGRLVGEADVTHCQCEPADDCDCRASAAFFPCQGACAAGASTSSARR